MHENKYWTLFLELMVIFYFLVKVNASYYYSLIAVMFMMMHEFPFVTRMTNFLVALIALASYAYFWNLSINALSIVLAHFLIAIIIFVSNFCVNLLRRTIF